MQIETAEFKNITENFSQAIFKEKVKTTSLDSGILKFHLGNNETKGVKVEQVMEFYDSLYDKSKESFKSGHDAPGQHEALRNKFMKTDGQSLSVQDQKTLHNLERLKIMKRKAREEAHKLSGLNGREMPKGEYQVYSPTKKRNVGVHLQSSEDAEIWLKKYQSVEPREQLVILKNNIPVKNQPGIKQAVQLQRNNQSSRTLGFKI